MTQKMSSLPENIGKRRAYFWLGVALMIFGLIINPALIVVFEVYPMLIIGIIISLFSFAFGLLSALRSFMPFSDGTGDAVTKIDGILLVIAGAIIVFSLLFMWIEAGITWWGFVLHLIMGVALIAGFLGIEQKGVPATPKSAVIITATVVSVFALVFVGYMLWGFTVLDLLFGIFLIALGVIYMGVQFRETPEEFPLGLGLSDANIPKRYFQLFMLLLTHITSAIVIAVGINLIIVSAMFEILLLGYILTGIGIGLLVLSVVMDGTILYKSVTVPDSSDARAKLWLITLIVGIGVAVAAIVGYILVYYVL